MSNKKALKLRPGNIDRLDDRGSTLRITGSSKPIGRPYGIGSAVSAVPIAHAARALTDVLPVRPRQRGVAVEIRAGHRVGEIPAFDVDLKSLIDREVSAGREPLERTRDRGPTWNLRALRTVGLITRGVIPVDVGAEASLVVKEPRRQGHRRLLH